mgnify:CR=1 FL=1
MLGRLFSGLHWILFSIFLSFWLVVISTELSYGSSATLKSFPTSIIGEEGSFMFGVTGLMTWIPMVFLFIDYVINGKLILFPWQRNKQ